MMYFLVFLLVVVGTFWVILRVFSNKQTQSTAGAPPTNLSGGLSNLVGSIITKGLIRPILTIGLITILYFFWSEISTWLAELLATSEAGKLAKLKTESVQSWLWVPGVVISSWALWGLLQSKNQTKKKPEPIPLVHQLTEVIVVLVLATASIGIIWIVLGLFGHTDAIESAILGSEGRKNGVTAECADETFMNVRVGTDWEPMVVCKEGGAFHVIPKWNHRLEFRISSDFNQSLIQKRSLEDFVTIKNPKTYPGSLAETYLVIPVKSFTGYISGFDQSRLHSVVIEVRSVK